ncbi:mycofactocin radical SAM maturase, partial [Streptomyces sp. MCAF7]
MKLSVVCTRHNIPQLDAFKALADRFGAQLRLTRLRPSGRGADVWDTLHPTADQQRELYTWLLDHGESVLTGDSFFHLSAYGRSLPGLNLCGAGRVVCLIDPVGDVYACPFAIHDEFRAGNVREPGGF